MPNICGKFVNWLLGNSSKKCVRLATVFIKNNRSMFISGERLTFIHSKQSFHSHAYSQPFQRNHLYLTAIFTHNPQHLLSVLSFQKGVTI